MSRLVLAGSGAIAVAVLAPQAPLLAQNEPQSDRSITVSAPTARQMELRSDNKSLTPQPVLISQSVVYTGDLDLRSQPGRDELDSRVQAAAERTCDRIDQLDPPSALDGDHYSDCVSRAVQGAQNQIYAAIWNS